MAREGRGGLLLHQGLHAMGLVALQCALAVGRHSHLVHSFLSSWADAFSPRGLALTTRARPRRPSACLLQTSSSMVLGAAGKRPWRLRRCRRISSTLTQGWMR